MCISLLPGNLRVVGLHPWESMHDGELGVDRSQEKDLFGLHGTEVEGNRHGVVGDTPTHLY